MKSYDPTGLSTGRFHSHLLSAIAPRPIAFASTIDADGNPNLAPFSFFNAFGSNPSTLIFSPARRVRENTIKHTLVNVREVPEVVINVVTYGMVEQMNIAAMEFEKQVNEFDKSGFTMLPSELIKPFRVAESPVQFECKVRDVIETGTEGGAGNLVVCEVIRLHVDEALLDDDERIMTDKLDLVGRMGGGTYVRASGSALFDVAKPGGRIGMGVDALPETIRNSTVLTGNDLGLLAGEEQLPGQSEIDALQADTTLATALAQAGDDTTSKHQIAKDLLAKARVQEAWAVLLS
jgi:flavin reductase (DIM6/NTAB) family NADH-FMN oxidoreductase RutF